ncbi:hypothetical protein BN59_01216 [Legionella massiliensis]|uniref:Uncharacterized protein n=1 Tax=Legionella massiliensis TaxID=1034943 RepID=A0A078KVE1_9GAMM|nr:hypothetical protein [Legionella massiliensis]CDZ76937.1 hypothetical protein BN59_01216 [Legionella massiliensis]CEE12675.1 hypothetical protein BN1094_01216 [Legionella massiliensis]
MKLFKTTNQKSTKSIVIEFYSPDETHPPAIEHELLSNSEIGAKLRNEKQQTVRYIYALNDPIIEGINDLTVINLADDDNLHAFANSINQGDSLTILAQGDKDTQTVAGYSAEEFVEILQIDLGLRGLHTVELFAAHIGHCTEFRETVVNSLNCAEHFITYKGIPTANETGICGFVEDDSEMSDEDEEKTLRFLGAADLDEIRVVEKSEAVIYGFGVGS